MKSQASAFLLLSSFIAGTLVYGKVAADPGVFLESGGLLVMEVESTEAAEGWRYQDFIDGYTGTGFYEWTGPDLFSVGQAGQGILKYTFEIKSAGNYQLKWRSRIVHNLGATESNDSWVRFPTGQNIENLHPLTGWTKVFMNDLRQWSWDTRTEDNPSYPVRQYFSEGTHTMEISGRSNGHIIDRMVLYKYQEIPFDEATFTAYPETDNPTNTGNPNQPVGPLDREPEDPDPVDPEPDYSAVASPRNANVCSGDKISVSPVSNIHTDNQNVLSSGDLRIDGNSRKSLLKFDLTLIPTANSAAVSFTVGTDNGNGTIVLSTGSHSDWTEDDSSLTTGPVTAVELGRFTGTWASNERYALPLDPESLSDTVNTLILEMTANDDDTSLLALINENGPRLELTGDTSFCQSHQQLVDEAAQQAAAEKAAAEQAAAEQAAAEKAAAEQAAAEQAAKEKAEAEAQALIDAENARLAAEEERRNAASTGLGTLLALLGFSFLSYTRRSSEK